MAIEWPSLEEKIYSIGYLAMPGVVSAIEATVPLGKKEKFRNEFEGHYSDEYPYEANKYGRQFRIYLNNTEDCPSFLLSQLDVTYKNRINDTAFIEELVKDYGFRFTKEPQDFKRIKTIVEKKHKNLSHVFLRGFTSNIKNTESLETTVFFNYNNNSFPDPIIVEKLPTTKKGRRKGNDNSSEKDTLPQNQKLIIGWTGEMYFYYLLKSKCKSIIDAVGINAEDIQSIEWFNEGVVDSARVVDATGITPTFKREWEDQSVGKGCDLLVKMSSGKELYFEIKTSKKTFPTFAMTSYEMQMMEKHRLDYLLIKINHMDRLNENNSPEIIIIKDPYDALFHPKDMKSAEFYLEGGAAVNE